MCKVTVVVLLKKAIAFLLFSLPSPSSLLKLLIFEAAVEQNAGLTPPHPQSLTITFGGVFELIIIYYYHSLLVPIIPLSHFSLVSGSRVFPTEPWESLSWRQGLTNNKACLAFPKLHPYCECI